ncbi:MAG: SDR family oxidoreductase [Anaerolineales bacterium]|nr:SDR family oxidoreductase [Anaerolineales bacterium]
MAKYDFYGKVALVTGATSGIGQAAAVRLAREGALVGVNHRASGDPGKTLALIKEFDGKAFAVEADMRKPDEIEQMVHETTKRGGRLDYLVSNAAINPLLQWDTTTLDDYNRIQETNLRGTWVVCQAAAKQMIAEGHKGAIVTVSSISAYVGAREQIVYCGTKAGIVMLTKGLATVLGQHGIRINCVLPGAILTPMSSELVSHGSPVRKYYEDRTPLGYIGRPEEVANVITFLLSDEASYMHSSEVLVDGGFITNAE